jgi:hypothetical protein
MTECFTMKRPGKPDTGNPFVRFDEGRSDRRETDHCGRLNSPTSLRLLYRVKSSVRARGRACGAAEGVKERMRSD